MSESHDGTVTVCRSMRGLYVAPAGSLCRSCGVLKSVMRVSIPSCGVAGSVLKRARSRAWCGAVPDCCRTVFPDKALFAKAQREVTAFAAAFKLTPNCT